MQNWIKDQRQLLLDSILLFTAFYNFQLSRNLFTQSAAFRSKRFSQFHISHFHPSVFLSFSSIFVDHFSSVSSRRLESRVFPPEGSRVREGHFVNEAGLVNRLWVEMDLMTNDDNESSIIISTTIIKGIVMIIIIIITIMPGIANVGGLAGTQMPERVLSDAYEKGGKQMIGHIISIVILFITSSSFNSSSAVKLIIIIICCNNFEPLQSFIKSRIVLLETVSWWWEKVSVRLIMMMIMWWWWWWGW